MVVDMDLHRQGNCYGGGHGHGMVITLAQDILKENRSCAVRPVPMSRVFQGTLYVGGI